MPRRIQPPTLMKSSIQIIADNYNYWCKGLSPFHPDFVSPFQYLGDDVIQELVVRVFKNKRTSDIQVTYLFHNNLRRLDLSKTYFNYRRQTECFRVLGLTCKRLTHLNLSGMYAVSPRALCELVSQLPHLVSLQLKNTQTDRQVLRDIIANCGKLIDLNVEGCSRLVGPDLTILCHFPEPPRSCLKLKKIMFDQEMHGLSASTVVALLTSHPGLISLGKCELIGEALWQMHGQQYQIVKSVPWTWVRKLTDICIVLRRSPTLSQEIVFGCCPNLTTLTLNLLERGVHSEAASVSLSSQKELIHLTSQTMGPILRNVGRGLTQLNLLHVCGCLILIGESCPNLQALRIWVHACDTKSAPEQTVNSQTFRRLQLLEIAEKSALMPKETLSMVLENAVQITELRFFLVQNLTDNMISNAIDKHGFPSLRHVEFLQCHSITNKSGMALLRPDNRIEHMAFVECRNVNRGNISLLTEYAKHRAFDITIDTTMTSIYWNKECFKPKVSVFEYPDYDPDDDMMWGF